MSDSIEDLVTKTGMIAWHDADDASVIVDDGLVVPDKSGNGRTINCPTSYPTLTADYINGHKAIVFDGSHSPLIRSGSVTPKHVFVVAAYADATFPAVSSGAQEYAGLIGGISNGNAGMLVGDPSTTQFVDNDLETAGTYTFRRRDVQFTEALQECSMSNAVSIFEISLSVGWALNGIQVGHDRSFSDRKWKGPFCMDMMWSRVLTEPERHDVYEYLALKYLLWRRISSGLDVWPFQADWGQPLGLSKRVLSSTSVSGASKSRSKGTKKLSITPQFSSRWPEEYDAAVAFNDAKYPGTSFIYRDETFSPVRDTEMLFLSEIQQQSADYRDITYTFQAAEV